MPISPSDGWSYYKEITITDSSSVSEDYQIKFTVHSGSGSDDADNIYCENNCLDFPDDIRFGTTNSASTAIQLKQYYEEINGSQVTVWLRLPAANTIYMFIGRATTDEYSSGTDVFYSFDDFEDGTDDEEPDGWYIHSDIATTVQEDSNYAKFGDKGLKLVSVGSGSPSSYTYRTVSSITDSTKLIEFYRSAVVASANYYQYFALFDSESDGSTDRVVFGSFKSSTTNPFIALHNGSSWSTLLVGVTGTKYKLTFYNFDFTSETFDVDIDDVNEASDFPFQTGSPSDLAKIGVRSGGSNDSCTTSLDAIYVRKWNTAEPYMSSWGSWTEISQPAGVEYYITSESDDKEINIKTEIYGNEIYIPVGTYT